MRDEGLDDSVVIYVSLIHVLGAVRKHYEVSVMCMVYSIIIICAPQGVSRGACEFHGNLFFLE